MKKILLTCLILCVTSSFVKCEQVFVHPIDKDESVCKENAKTLEEWSKCTYNASKAWNREVDKYYSLLYKKLTGDAKTALFEDQKYWTMYKNNEIKVINSLYNENYETKDRLIFRADQKKNLAKSRAEALRLYYIQTFSDDDKEKIKVNSDYNPDNIIIRGLRYIGF